ncbi:hypothetical protein NW762_011376 [Fusarium torreyae]|uniref:Uncharacterized protein n=1 Tax=Fusarium torreyae TaxID=1237075 RepID=A0A9W8V9Q8_9HYPO|nr:hypothetical protein NW762_011376 [Fusarium torreyae]
MATSSSMAHLSSPFSSAGTRRGNAVRESRLPRSVPASPRQSVTSLKLNPTPNSSRPASKTRDEHRATSTITTKAKAPSNASQSPRSSSSDLSRASSPNTEQSGYDRGLKGTNTRFKGQGSTESEHPTSFLSAVTLLKEILYFLKNDEEWRINLAPDEDVRGPKTQPIHESETHHNVEAQMKMLASQLKQESEKVIRANTEEDVNDWKAKYKSLQLERNTVQEDLDRISDQNDNLFDLVGKEGKEKDVIKAENKRLEKENERLERENKRLEKEYERSEKEKARLEKELDTYRIQERYRKENAPKCATTQTENIVEHFSSQSTQTDSTDLTPQPLVSPGSQDDTLSADPHLRQEVDQLRQDNSMLSRDFPVTQEPPANALQSDNDTTIRLHREMEIDGIPPSQAELEIGDQAMICTTQQVDVTTQQDVEQEHAVPDSPLNEPLEIPTAEVVQSVQPQPMEQQHPKETKTRKRKSKHHKDCHRSETTKRRGKSSFGDHRDHAIKKKCGGRGQPHRKHRREHERENPSLVLCRSPLKPSGFWKRLRRGYRYWVTRPQNLQTFISLSNLLTG